MTVPNTLALLFYKGRYGEFWKSNITSERSEAKFLNNDKTVKKNDMYKNY